MTTSIYKVLREAEWAAFQAETILHGSPDDLRDGFIHFSGAAQLLVTMNKYFAGEGQVHLLAVDAAPLGRALRWETSRDGAEFPHLYGPLELSAVAQHWVLDEIPNGGYELPENLG